MLYHYVSVFTDLVTREFGEWIRKISQMTLPLLSLVIGGAASGKSAYSEQIVTASGSKRVYLATSRVYDAEMKAKVSKHISDRGEGWRTIEEPLDIKAALSTCKPDEVVLLDCATMWLTNVIMDEADIAQKTELLLHSLQNAPCPVVVVTNEVGQGIVPDNKLARQFRDAQGQLNQKLAAQANLVVLVTAGLPLALKGTLPE